MAKWDDFKLACAGGCCACTCLSLLIGLIVILCSIVKLDPREQVVVKSPDGWWTKEGPWQGLMDPGKSKEYRKATLLQENDYALVKNFRTGARRIEEGPHLMFIGAYEELVHVEKKIVMQVREYARLRNVLNGSRFVVDGQEQSILVPGPYDEIEILAEKRTLEVTDYVRLKNSLTGVNRIIAGPALIMPGPYEEVMETTRKVELQLDQYVRVINSETGSERIVRGPATFVPDPMDTWQGVQDGVYVAADQALVARDKVTGVQRLVTELGVFVPNDYEEVVELRNLVRVGPQEAVVVRGPDGNFVVHDGRSGGAQGDPESDVWYHSRSVLIQAVSQSNLDTFMKEFNNITQQAFIAQSKDGFYDTRGVEVQSMEVTRFECVDPETAAVLQEIIRETTNRINRLQTQESENEVRASALTANIQLELQRGQLIRTQAANVRLEASTGGAKDGARLAAEASTFINGLNQTVDNATMRLDLYKMHEEHRTKNNQTQSLSKGDAKLYLVPSDLNLRLDVANGAGDSADSGARRLRGSRPNQEQEDEGAPLEL